MLDILHLTLGYKGRMVIKDLSLSLPKGESIALLGKSGSGKTSLALAITGLLIPAKGEIYIEGEKVKPLSWSHHGCEMRKKVQMIFQDPFASLNPKQTVRAILTEPFIIHRKPADENRLKQLLEMVGLSTDVFDRHPGSFSGGQRQRIAIARSLAVSPKLLILDESLSALDVVMQREILQILKGIRKETGMSFFFITHQEKNAYDLCERVGVLENGAIRELL